MNYLWDLHYSDRKINFCVLANDQKAIHFHQLMNFTFIFFPCNFYLLSIWTAIAIIWIKKDQDLDSPALYLTLLETTDTNFMTDGYHVSFVSAQTDTKKMISWSTSDVYDCCCFTRLRPVDRRLRIKTIQSDRPSKQIYAHCWWGYGHSDTTGVLPCQGWTALTGVASPMVRPNPHRRRGAAAIAEGTLEREKS